MRHAIVLVLAVLLLASATAVARPADAPYIMVRVDLTDPAVQEAVLGNPDLDVADLKPDSHAEIVARPVDLDWLAAEGLPHEILIEDLEKHYAARSTPGAKNMGNWHSYSEMQVWLDDLHNAYPDVVSAKWSIGQSGQGNDLWCVRVSDNPEVDEMGEPEVLFDGMHHAREIMASETPAMLIEYLGSNYGIDPVITHLLDTREIYVVPIVNPDGFLYNEQTNPSGGGMWRKNRRDNGGGSYGVDPNRNYPYEWVGPGSSTNPDSDVYRGPSAGSEPEIQAMMALVNAHAFVTSQSFHSYSNLTLYPWGHTLTPSPHASTYEHMAGIMTRENGYAPGTAPELLYEVNGGSFDWVYGDGGEHPICFAFTNEIGGYSDGFWPDYSRRDALFQENLWPSLYQIMAAGVWVEAHTPAVVGGDANGRLDAGETAGLSFSVENLGVATSATDVTVTLSTKDPYIQLLETTRSLGGLGAMSFTDLAGAPFMVTVDPNLPASRTIMIHVSIDADGVASGYDLAYPAGSQSVIFADDFESGTSSWTLTGNWASTSSSYHSAGTSITDTPGGDYSNDTTSSATTAAPISLPGGATLSFWHSYEIESGWDYGYVQVSTDGSSWNTMATYTGFDLSWHEEIIDLSAYAGQDVYLRFELVTDYSITYDGWYVDDVSITGTGSGNGLPPAPALLDPAEGAETTASPTLACAEVVDPEADPVTYGFRVYDDAALTNQVFATHGVSAAGGQAEASLSGLTPGATYWWRAFAADPSEWGLMGETRSFTVSTSTGVGAALPDFGLRTLGNGSGTARLQLQLPAAGHVKVDIYNARGQVVRALESGHRGTGAHVLTWDGEDGAGRQAPSGVYFVRAKWGAESAVGRVLLVR